jgi:hypothetical protein
VACRTDFVTKVKRFGLLAEGEPYRQIIFPRELGGGSRRPLPFGVWTDWGKQRLRLRGSPRTTAESAEKGKMTLPWLRLKLGPPRFHH